MNYIDPNTNNSEGQDLLDSVNEIIPDCYEGDIFEQLDDMINEGV